jgi:hypothetical protein
MATIILVAYDVIRILEFPLANMLEDLYIYSTEEQH